jgi:hypothetical protein
MTDDGIDTFNLHVHENAYLLLLQQIDQFKCICNRSESVDIENIISQFNTTMENLTELYNTYVDFFTYLDNNLYVSPDVINVNIPKFNLRRIIYQPVLLNSYQVPVSYELVVFLGRLENEITQLHSKITGVNDMIPRLPTVQEIDEDLEIKLFSLLQANI